MAEIEGRPSKIRKLLDTSEKSEGSAQEHPAGSDSTENDLEPTNHQLEDEENDISKITIQIQNEEKPTLSKSQLKKLRKAQEWEANRESRKAKRRDKHKEKQARKAEARAALQAKIANGETDVTATAPIKEENRRPPRPIQTPVTLILDCDFDQFMTEKELISLGAQVTRCYSENRSASYRSHMVISSWGGKLKARFEGVLANHHVGWKGVRFIGDDFVAAAQQMDGVMRSTSGGKLVGALSPPEREGTEGPEPGSKDSEPSKASLVYLTSDSPHTLERLSPNTSYIIGGIVDKNRHKGLCYKRACERGIPTAKLPIGEYMTMQSRAVLTINHVMEIMLKWLEKDDWGEAFLSVIPKRKEARLKVKNNAKVPQDQDESDDDGEGGMKTDYRSYSEDIDHGSEEEFVSPPE